MHYCISILLFLVCLQSASIYGRDEDPPLYGQVLFGNLYLDDRDIRIDDLNEELVGELPGHIPYLGAVAQVIKRDSLLGYGWEGGGFFSWYNDDVSYYASGGGSGGTISIRVDNQFWSFETFMGGYVSVKPVSWWRFYLSGGPLFLFAAAKTQQPDSDNEIIPPSNSGTTIWFDADKWHTDFTLGAYARAGFDWYIANDFWLGFSVRYMRADVDLSKSIGDFRVDGTLYFISLTRKY